MVNFNVINTQNIWKILGTIPDPEVPVISIVDLGIVRDVNIQSNQVEIIITPTYTGCPAMDMISVNIKTVLENEGFSNIKVTSVLAPAWTTDWMSEEGKQKLKEYGIAPPNKKQQVCTPDLFIQDEAVACPRCNTYHTVLVSRFGSTACKALYKCNECNEPYDYFKCH